MGGRGRVHSPGGGDHAAGSEPGPQRGAPGGPPDRERARGTAATTFAEDLPEPARPPLGPLREAQIAGDPGAPAGTPRRAFTSPGGGDRAGPGRGRPGGAGRGDAGHHRPLRLRQVHPPAGGRRAGARGLGPGALRRAGRQRRAPRRARDRDGLPELRPLPAHGITGEPGLLLPPRRRREEEIDERVRLTAEIMGLGFDELLERKPGRSPGASSRLAIGRCIARDPRLFLLDEPLSSLDARLRAGRGWS